MCGIFSVSAKNLHSEESVAEQKLKKQVLHWKISLAGHSYLLLKILKKHLLAGILEGG